MSRDSIQPEPRVTFQEALRSLGALLDAVVAPRVCLAVDADGIFVDAPGGLAPQRFTWTRLRHLSEARATLRGHQTVSAERPLLTRWEGLLRLAGRALDDLGLQGFELYAAVAPRNDPTRCYLEVIVDGRRLLSEHDVAEQLRQIQDIRRARGEDPETLTEADFARS